MCLAHGPQRSDAGEARTRGPSVSSQALYYWATALPRVVSLGRGHGCIFFGTINEPVHEISNNVVCATSKASDQPAHMRSLIRAFASRLNIQWLLNYWLNTIWSF